MQAGRHPPPSSRSLAAYLAHVLPAELALLGANLQIPPQRRAGGHVRPRPQRPAAAGERHPARTEEGLELGAPGAGDCRARCQLLQARAAHLSGTVRCAQTSSRTSNGSNARPAPPPPAPPLGAPPAPPLFASRRSGASSMGWGRSSSLCTTQGACSFLAACLGPPCQSAKTIISDQHEDSFCCPSSCCPDAGAPRCDPQHPSHPVRIGRPSFMTQEPPTLRIYF